MKTVNFSAWTVRGIAANTLTGGGLNFDNIGFAVVAAGRFFACLEAGNGARIKFMDAFEEVAAMIAELLREAGSPLVTCGKSAPVV